MPHSAKVEPSVVYKFKTTFVLEMDKDPDLKYRLTATPHSGNSKNVYVKKLLKQARMMERPMDTIQRKDRQRW